MNLTAAALYNGAMADLEAAGLAVGATGRASAPIQLGPAILG